MNCYFLAMFDENSKLSELLTIIPLSGMLIVFGMLILLVIVISIFGAVMKTINKAPENKKPEKKVNIVPKPTVNAASDIIDDEIVAVIAAAVDAIYGDSGKRAVIRSVKPSADNGGRTAWAQAGLRDNLRAF